MKLLLKIALPCFAFLLLLGSANTAKAQATLKDLPIAVHYEGGIDSLLADIHAEIKYPPMAKRNRKQGTAKVSVTLTEDGQLINIRCLSSPGAGTQQEALRVVKTLKWNPPGYQANYTIPVKFKL